jgi:AraC-like DNA-binding protein
MAMAHDLFSGDRSTKILGDPRGGVTPPRDTEPRASVYAVRLLSPFVRILAARPDLPHEWGAAIGRLDPDDRIPSTLAHQLLEGLHSLGVGPEVGLQAARTWSPGDGGALDHAVCSAATVRDAIYAARRYIRLVSDVVGVDLIVANGEAQIRLERFAPMPRVAIDFHVGSIFRLFRCIWGSGAMEGARVLFALPAPADTEEYRRTFEGLPVEFDAEFSGFAFDARYLDTRLSSADFRLHDVIRIHLEQRLQELPQTWSLTGWIESAIAAELPQGPPSVNRIATRLRMSTRTLERRLEREGTTFSDLLEDLRRRLALRYVANQGIPLGEVAFLLGFSHTTGFHRAFKRWTGETPLVYRRSQLVSRPEAQA